MLLLGFLLVICVVGQSSLCGKDDVRKLFTFDDVVVSIPVGVARLDRPYHLFNFDSGIYTVMDLINCNNPWFPEAQNMSGSPPNAIFTGADDSIIISHYANKPFSIMSLKLVAPFSVNVSVFVNTTKPNGQRQSSQLIVLPQRQIVTVILNQSRVRSLSISCRTPGSFDTCGNIHYDDIDVCYSNV